MSQDALARYQRAFAEILGAPGAFGFWKGRVALYAILRAMGIGEGDEVILPGYTCVMAANPIMYVGAKPVFVDIEPLTYNIDPHLIENKITPKTKLLIAQHTYGYPADLGAIMEIATRKGLPMVEDSCLALGSTYRGQIVGTFGLAAYFSFQWNKPLTTGLGGMTITTEQELAGKLDDLCRESLCTPTPRLSLMLALQRMAYRTFIYPRTTALATSMFRWLTKKKLLVGSSATCEFTPEMPHDFFMAMSQGQARAGLRQLQKLDANIAHRKQMRRVYDDLLREAGWTVPHIPSHMDPVLVRYPVRVANKDRALASAAKHLVELGSWFECPLHPIETPLEAYGYHTGMCPESERACREVVNLPLHPRTNRQTARRSVEFILDIGPASA